MVIGYGGLELDVAFDRGEIDARANGADTILQRRRGFLEKVQFHVHATITIPKGNFHSLFPNVPDLETLRETITNGSLSTSSELFSIRAGPIIVPPGTPPEIVKTLRGAMAKAFKDPDFHREFKKLMANEPTPLTGEEWNLQ